MNTKKLGIFKLLLFLLATGIPAQVHDTINGIITDSLTNAPIDSVLVASDGVSVKSKTDGTFSLIIAFTQANRFRQIQLSQKILWNNESGVLSWIGFSGDLCLRIFDARGRLLARSAPNHQLKEGALSIASFPSGLYLTTITAQGKTDAYRILRLRGSQNTSYNIVTRIGVNGPAMLSTKTAATQSHVIIFSKNGYSPDTLAVAAGTANATLLKVKLLPTSSSNISIPWDWIGIVGTGQSLSVGVKASTILSKTQPFNNLKLYTGTLPWKINPEDPVLKLVPLIEPIGRLTTAYPSGYPDHIKGETPHSSMANEVTSLVKAAGGKDYIGVHGAYGEDGQPMRFLKKNATPSGVNGRAFEATIIEVTAINRLAKAAGKTYGVGAIILTHGESDSKSSTYANEVYQLCTDYNKDISSITGQKQKIQLFLSQHNTQADDRAPSTLAEWKVGLDHPDDIVCAAPKYQYPYASDYLHLTNVGYQMLGEKLGEVYFERIVRGRNWQPLQPTTVSRSGSAITVHFNIPDPPLTWETAFSNPHPNTAAWKSGKGFEVISSAGTNISINAVAISGDAVIISCATDPGANARVSYALYEDQTQSLLSGPYAGTVRWGLLRDSDPFVGYSTKKAQPNFCVAFELTVP